MAKRNHIDYRAILLSMIHDPFAWGGKAACKELIVKWLEKQLKQVSSDRVSRPFFLLFRRDLAELNPFFSSSSLSVVVR